MMQKENCYNNNKLVIKKIIVGMLDTNCYILENNNECLIIDPGSEAEKIKSSISKNVVCILITHRHFDHIGALDELSNYYKVKVYDKSNLKEGINSIGTFKFVVQYNLGHTMDSISYIFNDIMFSGDFIFKGSIGRCDLGGDYVLMKESIKKIINSDINYEIYPGHGDKTYLTDELDNLKVYL